MQTGPILTFVNLLTPFSLTEKVGEIFRVEFGETSAIIDGLAHDEHRGEGEMIVVNNLGKVFEHTAIDFLVWPGEVIAGSDRRILWVFHQEFTLHIVDD